MFGEIAIEATVPIKLQPSANQRLVESVMGKAPRPMVRPGFLAKAAQAGQSTSPAPKL